MYSESPEAVAGLRRKKLQKYCCKAGFGNPFCRFADIEAIGMPIATHRSSGHCAVISKPRCRNGESKGETEEGE
ncbi:MAG: hypothetical protein RLN69_06590 [Woeseiaceae bacterium]